MANHSNSQIWKFINSAFGIWFLTTVIGGSAIWSFEKYLNERENKRILSERAERIDLEIEGRIAQYASWVDGIVIKNGGNRIETEFLDCVTNEYLHQSIKALGLPPKHIVASSFPMTENTECPNMFQPLPMIPELIDTSILGLFAERISISKKIESSEYFEGWQNAINPFLTPDALTGVEIGEDKPIKYKRFHASVSNYLYGFPKPEIFHYGDCFRC